VYGAVTPFAEMRAQAAADSRVTNSLPTTHVSWQLFPTLIANSVLSASSLMFCKPPRPCNRDFKPVSFCTLRLLTSIILYGDLTRAVAAQDDITGLVTLSPLSCRRRSIRCLTRRNRRLPLADIGLGGFQASNFQVGPVIGVDGLTEAGACQ
jgi:hypothetical protein